MPSMNLVKVLVMCSVSFQSDICLLTGTILLEFMNKPLQSMTFVHHDTFQHFSVEAENCWS